MNERMVVLSFEDGEVGVTLSTLFRYFTTPPFDLYLVYAEASPSADDAGFTLDLNNTGATVDAFLAPDTKAVPGTWKSTHVGGTNDPIKLPKNTVLNFDANSAASGTRVQIRLYCLTGE